MYWLKHNKHFLYLSILLIASIPAVFPLFHSGFFVTDDGEWMIIRFSAFYQALADGQFPVRFLHRLDFGYGYPVATFLYPGFMYFAIPLQILKLGFVTSIKIVMIFSLIGSAIFTYLWLSKIFQRTAAFVGALFALYLPYHLYDVYKRGSVGELFALLWVPFILWMMERKSVVLLSIGIGMLLLSHNTLALFFLPILFIYGWMRNVLSKKQLIVSFLLGGGLSAFFTIPVVMELPLTIFSQTKVSSPLLHFADLKIVGVSTLFVMLFGIFLFFRVYKDLKNHRKIILLFLFLSSITLSLGSSWSNFVWKSLLTEFVQFPFRFLSYFTISTAFLAAFIISRLRAGKEQNIAIVVFLAFLIYSALPFLTPKEYFDKGDGYYFTNDANTTVQNEYTPIWVKERPSQRPEKKAEIVKGEGLLKNVVYDNKKISLDADIKKDAIVRVNTIYWPGWQVFIDGKESVISYNNRKGLIEFSVPRGKHDIEVKFGETTLRLVSDWISIISLVLLVVVSLSSFPRTRKSRR